MSIFDKYKDNDKCSNKDKTAFYDMSMQGDPVSCHHWIKCARHEVRGDPTFSELISLHQPLLLVQILIFSTQGGVLMAADTLGSYGSMARCCILPPSSFQSKCYCLSQDYGERPRNIFKTTQFYYHVFPGSRT